MMTSEVDDSTLHNDNTVFDTFPVDEINHLDPNDVPLHYTGLDTEQFDATILDVNKPDQFNIDNLIKICDNDELQKEQINQPKQEENINFDDCDLISKINNGDVVLCSNGDDVKIGLLISDQFNQSNQKVFMFAEEVKITKYRCKVCNLLFDTILLVRKHFIDVHFEKNDTLLTQITNSSNVNAKDNCPTLSEPNINDEDTQCIPKVKRVDTKRTSKRRKNSSKKFACDWPDCNYVAKHSVHLRDHKCTHTGEKRYRCTWSDCGVSFIQSSALKSHMRTHTGERPFICKWPNCSMVFSQSSNLKVHMRTHTGEKPFQCDWPGCESRFAAKSNLDDHKKIHLNTKQYVCDYPSCNRRYIHNSHLRKHKLVHQETKLFSCDWPNCSYQASRLNDLINHKTTHTGEKKYPCHKCNKSFTRLSLFKRHLSMFHTSDDNQTNIGPNVTITDLIQINI